MPHLLGGQLGEARLRLARAETVTACDNLALVPAASQAGLMESPTAVVRTGNLAHVSSGSAKFARIKRFDSSMASSSRPSSLLSRCASTCFRNAADGCFGKSSLMNPLVCSSRAVIFRPSRSALHRFEIG